MEQQTGAIVIILFPHGTFRMWVPGATGVESGGIRECPAGMPAACPVMRCKWVPDPAVAAQEFDLDVGSVSIEAANMSPANEG